MNIRYPLYEGVYRILTIHALGEVDEKRKKMCSCAVWGG